MSRHQIAYLLLIQNKDTEALEEHRAVHIIRERVLGAEHPDTLRSSLGIAGTMYKQGQGMNEEALNHAQKAWEGMTRVLGAEHNDTKVARQVLDWLEPPKP